MSGLNAGPNAVREHTPLEDDLAQLGSESGSPRKLSTRRNTRTPQGFVSSVSTPRGNAPRSEVGSQLGSPRKLPARSKRSPHTPRQPSSHGGGVSKQRATGASAQRSRMVGERLYAMGFQDRLTRLLQAEKTPPTGPCTSALRAFVEQPSCVLITTFVLLVYLAVLSMTGPEPEGDGADGRKKLLFSVSLAGLLVWGFELQLKLVGYGMQLFFRDGWRCLELICYLSLLADVCGFGSGVAFVYLRVLEIPGRFDRVFAVLKPENPSWQSFEIAGRMVKSSKRMVKTFFITISSSLPLLCMIFVFVGVEALLGLSFFGSLKSDFLRNRCVKEMPPNTGVIAVSAEAREDGQVIQGVSSLIMYSDGGWAVETEPWALDGALFSVQPSLILVQPESHCSNVTTFGSYGCRSDDGQMCVYLKDIEPLGGFLSFDNAGVASIAVFLLMLQENLSSMVNSTVDSFGEIAVLWALIGTLIGAYILMTYSTALICNAYTLTYRSSQGEDNATTRSTALLLDQVNFEAAAPPSRGEDQSRQSKHAQAESKLTHSNDHTAEQFQDSPRRVPHGDAAEDREKAPLCSLNVCFATEKGTLESKRKTMWLLLSNCVHTVTQVPFLRALVSGAQSRAQVAWMYIQDAWISFVLGLRFLVIFPNSGNETKQTPWLDVIMDFVAIVHVAVLSTKHRSMTSRAADQLESLDGVMVLTFASVELARVTALGGPVKYVRRGPNSLFDLFMAGLTLIVWMIGWTSWLQLSAFRIMKLIRLFLALPWMGQTRGVLIVVMRHFLDLTSAVLILMMFLFTLSMIGWQIFGKVTFHNGAKPFDSFLSSAITIFGVAIGQEITHFISEGRVGADTVCFLMLSNVVLGHMISKIFTAVFLSNFVVSDHDRVAYQLQFDRLRVLWGWSEEQARHEWLTMNRPHLELLHQDGLPSILHPDASGIFSCISRFHHSHENPGEDKILLHLKGVYQNISRWLEALSCTETYRRTRRSKHLSALILRGRRLNFLDSSPNIIPLLYVRVRLERFDAEMNYAFDGEKDRRRPLCPPHHAEIQEDAIDGAQGLEPEQFQADTMTMNFKEGPKSMMNPEGDSEDYRGANSSQSDHVAHVLEKETAVSDTWNPEWKQELLLGPIPQLDQSCKDMTLIFEVWCKARADSQEKHNEDETVHISTPDIMLGRSYHPLSHLSKIHAQILVVPLKEPSEKEPPSYWDDNVASANMSPNEAESRNNGPSLTARLKYVTQEYTRPRPNTFLLNVLRRTAKSRYLDWIMLALVVGSTIDLLFVHSVSSERVTIDLVFLGFFVAEIMIKIIVFGTLLPREEGHDAFLASPWNQFDFLVVLLSLIAATFKSLEAGLARLYAFRAIRLARPLLYQSRFSGMRVASNALGNSCLIILALFVTTGFVLFSWSIASLYAFNGTLDHCFSSEKLMHLSKAECSLLRVQKDLFVQPMVWESPQWENFDAMNMAFFTMLRALDSNGWSRIVKLILVSEPVGHPDSSSLGLERTVNEEKVLPFILLQVLGKMMIYECIISIMINAINVSRRRAFLTRDQKAMKATERLVFEAKSSFVKQTSSEGYKTLQHIVNHSYFETFANSMIVLNVLLMLTEHHEAHADHVLAKDLANVVFIVWYIIEQSVKIIAFSASYVFPLENGCRKLNFMNLFDLLITLLALLELTGIMPSNGINILRSIRTIRLLQAIPSVGTLIQAIIKSSEIIVGCFFLLTITTVGYAVVGSSLFAGVKRGEFLNRQSNFDTPLHSFRLLCQIIGGEDWTSILDELLVSPPYCTPGAGSTGDCGSYWALPFLISFWVLVQYMFLPLVLASLICTFFEEVGQDTIISRHEIRVYVRTWQRLDPRRSGFIGSWKLRALLARLDFANSLLGLSDQSVDRDSLVDSLQKSRALSIAARRQSVTDGISFMDVAMGLITAYRYPWCIPDCHSRKITVKDISENGGLLEVWTRRMNATTIRDSLLLPPDQKLPGYPGSFHQNAGFLWRSYEGILHLWVLSAQDLPRQSANGSFCTVTLLRSPDEWKRKEVKSDKQEDKFTLQEEDEEASSRNQGPMFGWSYPDLAYEANKSEERKSSTTDEAQMSPISKGHFGNFIQMMMGGAHQTGDGRNRSKGPFSNSASFRGITFATRTSIGSRNPKWGDHFVLPIVNNKSSLLFSVAENSGGIGHKQYFGSTQTDMKSIMDAEHGVLQLCLSQERDKHEFPDVDAGNQSPGKKNAKIAVRFLYKRFEEGRIDVAAQAFKCLDTNVDVRAESPPSYAAPPPEPPASLQFYTETAFREMRLKTDRNHQLLQAAMIPMNKGIEVMMDARDKILDKRTDCSLHGAYSYPKVSTDSVNKAALENPVEPEQDLQHLQHLERQRGDEAMSLRHHLQIPKLSDRSGNVLALPAENGSRANISQSESTGLPSQIWSYFGGKGKTEKGIVMSRRSTISHKPRTSDENAAHDQHTDHKMRGNRQQTPMNNFDFTPLRDLKERLPPLDELEDEDESCPAAPGMNIEIEESETLSRYVTKVLSTPRGIRPRLITWNGGEGEMFSADDGMDNGSKISLKNSLSSLHGIVQERRSLVEERLKSLQSKIVKSAPSFLVSVANLEKSREIDAIDMTTPDMSLVPAEMEFEGARIMSAERSMVCELQRYSTKIKEDEMDDTARGELKKERRGREMRSAGKKKKSKQPGKNEEKAAKKKVEASVWETKKAGSDDIGGAAKDGGISVSARPDAALTKIASLGNMKHNEVVMPYYRQTPSKKKR